MGNEGKFATEGREREPSVEKRTRQSKAWCVKKHGLGRKVTGPSHRGCVTGAAETRLGEPHAWWDSSLPCAPPTLDFVPQASGTYPNTVYSLLFHHLYCCPSSLP